MPFLPNLMLTLVFAYHFSYTLYMEHVSAVEYAIPTVSLKEAFAPASTFTNLGSFVNIILKNAFAIAGVICLVLLIFGGFSFIVSAGSGDTKKMDQGKQTITSALIGLMLIIGAYWIVQIIGLLTGISILPQ